MNHNEEQVGSQLLSVLVDGSVPRVVSPQIALSPITKCPVNHDADNVSSLLGTKSLFSVILLAVLSFPNDYFRFRSEPSNIKDPLLWSMVGNDGRIPLSLKGSSPSTGPWRRY